MNVRTPRSLRVQVTAVVVAVLVLGLLLAGTAVTVVLRGYLQSRVDESVTGFAHNIVNRPMPIQPPPAGIANRGPSRFALAVVAADGTLTSVDEALAGAQVPAPGTIALGTPFTFDAPSGAWRGVLEQRPGMGDYALVAASLTEMNYTLDSLIRVQVIVGVIVVLAGGFLGFTLVTRRVRPLAHMAEVTDEIASGDLTRRVTDPPGSAEVAHLSASFNAMVDALGAALDTSRLREEQMRRFVGDAGHELRTPLTSIRGFAELATSGAGDPGLALARIESEAARMGVLVDDLLILAKMDAARPLENSAVDLAALLTERLARFGTLHEDYPIEASIPDNPVMVQGDELRLAQVVDNLLANVGVHTPPGTTIDVTLSQGDREVVLAIQDSGPGMSSEVADRVFERFYRGDASRTRATGGTGLGLSIVDVLVRAQGGTIDLVSGSGRGATFTVRLPKGA